MFREMRRKDREMDLAEAKELLERCDEGILSTISIDNGYPHPVCVNHYYDGEALYFHCAKKGHKLDNLKANNKVSFICTSDIEILQSKYATDYKSVIVYGRASIVEDDQLRKEVLYNLSKRYVGKFIANFAKELAGSFKVTEVVKIEIDHISGKKVKRK